MPVLPRLINTIRSLVGQERLDRELDAELRSYLDLRVDELVASGVEPEEARRRARLDLGIDQVKERVRDRRRGAIVDTIVRDVRLGVRLLVRNPAFALVSILTLAIGIGVTTAAFSTVHATLLRRLPYPDAERLVIGRKTFGDRLARWVSRIDYYDFRDTSRSFEGLAAMVDSTSSRVVLGRGEPWLAKAGLVTANLFPTLGIAPALGQGFRPEDDAVGDAPVMMISHALWRTRFASDPSVLGSTVNMGGRPFTIVGVMPEGFHFVAQADVWTLVDRKGPYDQTRDSHSHIVVGRLKSGVSIEQAQQEVTAIARGLAERFPNTNARKGLRLSPLHDYLAEDARQGLLLLMGVTALVLLIACANVAGLLLSRGQQRLPEMAMRSALGASRARLVRQLVTETVVLTGIGALLGLAIARGTLRLLIPLLAGGAAGLEPPALDTPVLLFALTVSIGAGILVGLVPALRGTAASPATHLSTARVASGTRHASRLRSSLVVAQVAFSLVLLVLSALFVRSLVKANSVELGFDPGSVLTANLQVPAGDFATPESRHAFIVTLLERIAALPGVVSVSGTGKLPILGRATDWPLRRADRPEPRQGEGVSPLARWVYPDYFRTMGMRLLKGRDFSTRDTGGAPKVVILGESVATALYGAEDPIGRPVFVWGQEGVFEVIGVVADAVLESPVEGKSEVMYLSAPQVYGIGYMVVRASTDPAALAGSIRRVVRSLNPNTLLASERTLQSIVDDALADFRVVIRALVLFGLAAVLLTAIGLYGALAYHVSQQQHELGVRMAVGASRGSVLTLILRRGAVLAIPGLALGVAGAAAASRLVRGLLFDTTPLDAPSYAAALALLVVVSAAACLIPAWRATRIDPVGVLRGE